MSDSASMDQLFLAKVHKAIEKNLATENFGVDELAQEIGISRSQLHRRLKSFHGQSASQMIREFRLKKAHEMLQNKVATASEISYQVGFSSPSYFNTSFHEYFGYPPGKAKHTKSLRHLHKYSNSRKFLFIIAITLVAAFTVVLVHFETRNPDKSIAVLPLNYLSDDTEKQFLADAVMDAIRLHLCKIEDLRVVSRMSVEQYRQTDKTAIQICKELDVAYLLEGSFQIHGNQVRIIVQLIEPGREERYLWTQEYNRNWKDILPFQSEVAQTIAGELQAVIKPAEKERIERIPTIDLTAFEFYARGREEHVKYWSENQWRDVNANREALERVENLYLNALEYDSTYAQAYAGLAWVLRDKQTIKTLLSENFLDSMLILANVALSYNDQLAEGYVLRGNYFQSHNMPEWAKKEYDKAIEFDPNDWQAYWHMGWLFRHDNFVQIIYNYQKAASLQRGPLLPVIYRYLGFAYAESGFKKKSIYYYEQALKLDDDSAAYYRVLGGCEESYCNFENAINYYHKSLAVDSTDWFVSLRLGIVYSFIGQNEEYLEYVKKYELRYMTYEGTGSNWIFWIGHAYWVNGFKEKAEYYFNAGLEYNIKMLELDRAVGQNVFIYNNLAAIYAFRGDKEKAYEYLRLMNQSQRFPLFAVKDINNFPLFDSIRDEPEFQKIVRDIEAKVQTEHERVGKWPEENEML